ncbi:MAG: hypothetical protein WAN05_10930 [Roseiarcus sp.]
MEDMAGWLTEEQLIAETGVGHFTLDRRRREGLVPWDRRFLDFGVGTVTVYPPIAVPMIRRLQELQQAFKGVDRWRWALWLEGYPIDIIKWHNRLLRLKNRAEALAKGNIKTSVVQAVGKGRLRGKPHQPIFNHVRQWRTRQAVLEWSVTVGVGSVLPASVYTPGSPAAKAFSKATSAAQPPDRSLEIETMSFERLHKIITRASVSDIELARLDCNRLAGLVTLAASLDWRRVRDALGVTHQGGPATPIAPFERLVGLWDNLDFRACLIPFLMFVRSRPGYRYELDERFACLEIELQTLSERVASEPSS